MSFQPNPSDVALCNRALSRLSQSPIVSIDPPQPQGTSSRACALWYKATVARLLEMHHWSLARKRVTLTEVTNDRTSEWTYLYELPGDVAFPVTLAPLGGTSGLQYYRGLAGLLATLYGKPAFLKVGNRLYANYSGVLDYVSYDISEANFNATFENIVELTLAAAICFDITKSRTREEGLRDQATSAVNLAITQDLNAGNPRYGDEMSQRDIVRGDSFAAPWDWWPGIRP
jgi:hypothetical protein